MIEYDVIGMLVFLLISIVLVVCYMSISSSKIKISDINKTLAVGRIKGVELVKIGFSRRGGASYVFWKILIEVQSIPQTLVAKARTKAFAKQRGDYYHRNKPLPQPYSLGDEVNIEYDKTNFLCTF